MSERIVWGEIEWADVGTTAYFKGYVADVFKTDLKLYGQPFAWTVKATMEVSEWPELQASGGCREIATGKRAAEKALRRAASQLQKRRMEQASRKGEAWGIEQASARIEKGAS